MQNQDRQRSDHKIAQADQPPHNGCERRAFIAYALQSTPITPPQDSKKRKINRLHLNHSVKVNALSNVRSGMRQIHPRKLHELVIRLELLRFISLGLTPCARVRDPNLGNSPHRSGPRCAVHQGLTKISPKAGGSPDVGSPRKPPAASSLS